MKHKSIIIAVLLVSVCGAGCATNSVPADTNRMYETYVNQPPTAELLTIRAPAGQTIKLSVEGAEFISVSTLLTPKSILPKDPSTMERLIDGTASVLKWGIGGYYSSKILSEAFAVPKTVDPLVVNPEIVYVPTPAP